MAASRILLVLLSISLLALTSAQRANEDDENSPQDQEALEEGDANQQNGGIHKGLNEIKNHLQDQLNQHGEESIKLRRGKNGQGRNRRSADDSLEGQDLQSENQRGGDGQGDRGRRGQKGQKGKGGQKGQKGKGGQKGQKGKGGQKGQKGKGGRRNQQGQYNSSSKNQRKGEPAKDVLQ
ncbi:uncharacterized protein LOC690326 isoform X1 [Rattus norvegicus]|uniref:uncharacterized protein LOC690326 isoform 2 precursor n=1 Tax=Rattus norvegicus TaxID=10116 RepID=UPI0019176A71|nr:uncharacterized protein LOC690326 isoform X1 [Rattus norvegicus]